MRELKRMHALMVTVSLVFAVGTQVLGVGLISGVTIEGTQGQSDNSGFSFGEGSFTIDGKTPRDLRAALSSSRRTKNV
jgi:hypothetical protein